jgi:hypothetical protein
MFDKQVNNLIDFFREVIKKHQNKISEQADDKKPLFPPISQKALADNTSHAYPKLL